MSERTLIGEIEEHQVRTGETLQSLAEANGLTAAELARFNFGTDDPDAVNDHLHNDVGCTRRDASGQFIFDDNDDPGIILIPKPWEQPGLATDQFHTIRVREPDAEKNLHRCICVPGVTFEFDKSFIRPTVVDHMARLDAALIEFPNAKLIVFGHTDRTGGEQYNKELSERRAKSAYAFVTDQPDIWEQLFQQESWGMAILQDILRDLGHDPGPSDGIQGDQTTAAIKSFQASRGLTVDGVAGVSTRRQMFLDYMTGKHNVRVDDSQFFPPKFMGCGEFNPLVEPNEHELANNGQGRAPGNEPNRRVVFYLFRREPRTLPCQLRALGPCKTEIAKPGERRNPLLACAFYDGIAEKCNCERGETFTLFQISLLLRSNSGALPARDEPFKLTLNDGTVVEGETNEDGKLFQDNVPVGDHTLEVGGITITVPAIHKGKDPRMTRVPGFKPVT